MGSMKAKTQFSIRCKLVYWHILGLINKSDSEFPSKFKENIGKEYERPNFFWHMSLGLAFCAAASSLFSFVNYFHGNASSHVVDLPVQNPSSYPDIDIWVANIDILVNESDPKKDWHTSALEHQGALVYFNTYLTADFFPPRLKATESCWAYSDKRYQEILSGKISNKIIPLTDPYRPSEEELNLSSADFEKLHPDQCSSTLKIVTTHNRPVYGTFNGLDEWDAKFDGFYTISLEGYAANTATIVLRETDAPLDLRLKYAGMSAKKREILQNK